MTVINNTKPTTHDCLDMKSPCRICRILRQGAEFAALEIFRMASGGAGSFAPRTAEGGCPHINHRSVDSRGRLPPHKPPLRGQPRRLSPNKPRADMTGRYLPAALLGLYTEILPLPCRCTDGGAVFSLGS